MKYPSILLTDLALFDFRIFLNLRTLLAGKYFRIYEVAAVDESESIP